MQLRTVNPNDWQAVRQNFQRLNSSLGLGPNSKPTYAGLTLTELTASRLVATDVNKLFVSSDLTSWITQTANQVLVADDGDGTITLSAPQNIHTGASPTFAGLTLSSLNVDSGILAVNLPGYTDRVGIRTATPSNPLQVPWISGDNSTTILVGHLAAGNDQIAIHGASSSNYGIWGQSISSVGVYSSSTTGLAFQGIINPATYNSLDTVMKLYRRSSSAELKEAGIGGSIDFYIENTVGSDELAGRIGVLFTDPTDGEENSAMVFYLREDGAVVTELMRLDPYGNLRIGGSKIGIIDDTNLLSMVSNALTVNGSLIVDTDTLVVDAVNHRTVFGGEDPYLWIQHDTKNEAASGHLDFTEDSYAFGATPGYSYGFRIKLDGSTNKLIIQSGNGTTITDRFSIERDTGDVGITGVLKIDDVQVVKEQQAHIADAPGDTCANNATTINAILAMLETHGLIAAA